MQHIDILSPIQETVTCQRLPPFMKAQFEVILRHLDEHKYLRHEDDKNKAVQTFIEDYGWLIREMYCSSVCDYRDRCPIAKRLVERGDLLEDHLPK